MISTAIYPGTFDPITYGHIDVIRKSLKIFDRIVVAAAENINKDYLFAIDERVEIIRDSLFKDLKLSKKKVLVIPFNTLTIKLCKQYKIITPDMSDNDIGSIMADNSSISQKINANDLILNKNNI